MITLCVDLTAWRGAFDALRPNNFSYEGLAALFEYHDSLTEAVTKSFELDVIAVCCEWTEYRDEEELLADYSCDPIGSKELRADYSHDSIDEVRECTDVISLNGGGYVVRNL